MSCTDGTAGLENDVDPRQLMKRNRTGLLALLPH